MIKSFTFFNFLFLFSFIFSFSALSEDIKTNAVKLRGVDKVSGRMTTFDAAIGKKSFFLDLIIEPSVCFKAPPEETPENKAFLKIKEKKGFEENNIFSGWMFSSSPALSAMEHPVYDVWVIECINTSENNSSAEKIINVPNEIPPLDSEEKINKQLQIEIEEVDELTPD